MSTFANLIEDLSRRLNRNLTPNKDGCVTLLIKEKITIQIEMDRDEDFLIIGAYIEELPPGKFREHILRDGLKANFFFKNNSQVLSYMKKENQLIVHQKMHIETTSPEDFFNDVQSLYERASKWFDSLDSGRSCPDDEVISKGDSQPNKSIYNV